MRVHMCVRVRVCEHRGDMEVSLHILWYFLMLICLRT